MKSHKEDIVGSAIQGLKEGGFEYAEVFRMILERVYECGYREAIRNSHPFENDNRFNRCHVCGIEYNKSMGYVCYNNKCPNGIRAV